MNEDAKDPARWQRLAAAQEAWWKRRIAAQQDEVLRQNNLMYGALIGVGVVVVQPFLTAPQETLGVAARICVLAFAVAIPMLAALIMLNRQEVFRRRAAGSWPVLAMRVLGLAGGMTGVVAGLWHIMPAAGIALLVSGFVAMLAHSSAFIRLEQEDAKATSDDAEPTP